MEGARLGCTCCLILFPFLPHSFAFCPPTPRRPLQKQAQYNSPPRPPRPLPTQKPQSTAEQRFRLTSRSMGRRSLFRARPPALFWQGAPRQFLLQLWAMPGIGTSRLIQWPYLRRLGWSKAMLWCVCPKEPGFTRTLTLAGHRELVGMCFAWFGCSIMSTGISLYTIWEFCKYVWVRIECN